MSIITIGNDILNYKTVINKYIITYLSDYDTIVDTYIENIFHIILNFYDQYRVVYSNRCGDNAKYM